MNSNLRFAAVLLVVLLGASLSAAGKDKPVQDKDKKASEATAKITTLAENGKDPSKYVGDETCITCHEEQGKGFESNPHYATVHDKRGVAYQGCESCHGPGKAHAESGGGELQTLFDPKKAGAAAVNQRCLECHEEGKDHSNFVRSKHASNNVGCTDCHSVHSPAPRLKRALLKAEEPTLCYSCHQDVKPEFSKPFHHRVNEKLVGCSDCHNPHGGFGEKQLRTTAAQDAGCFRCHSEKSGPFVFEHAPVKVEGCVSCHTPHGSSNPRLLRRANVNILCLECHTLTVDSVAPAIPSFHNQAQKYQACTMCHVAIHGSNSSNVFFR